MGQSVALHIKMCNEAYCVEEQSVKPLSPITIDCTVLGSAY